MKRTAATFMLLASLGGCMNTNQNPMGAWPMGSGNRRKKNGPYVGPYGEPIAPGNTPRTGMSPGIMPVAYNGGNARSRATT